MIQQNSDAEQFTQNQAETLDDLDAAWFAEHLTAWYYTVARDLPWRGIHDPYRIWLSEVMLQQTQVNTVLPFYHRFLQRFPSVQVLAAAPLDEVLKHWEGLGYYSRARNLHKAATIIAQSGAFPDSVEGWHALPGVGKSTAGAIACFTLGLRAPILDGNVKRVLSRWLDDPRPPAQTEARLWATSQAVVSAAKDPNALNQALMELGATVCLPKQPRCLVCPVAQSCLSRQRGTQQECPYSVKKPAVPHYAIAAGVIWDADHRILIQQRPEKGLLAGLWEFPGGKQHPDETLEQALARELHEELGIAPLIGEKIRVVKHAFTHFKITLHAYHCLYCKYSSDEPQPHAAQQLKWVTVAELADYAFPKANHAIIADLQKQPRSPFEQT